MTALSQRLEAIVAALPLEPGMRVLEIGGAPGAAAREVCRRIAPDGHILVVDRSARGIALTRARAAPQIAAGVLSTLRMSAEDLVLPPDEAPFDVVFAVRVGAFDGRHPQAGRRARARIRRALAPGGRFFIDGGDPLREIDLSCE